jgi:hypothetical protein
MGQLYAKNGLILGPIPKISPKSNFLKKLVTGPGTTGTGREPGPRFYQGLSSGSGFPK